MESTKTMTKKNLLVLLVTVLVFAIAAQSVSAFGTIESVEVNGIEALGGTIDLANFAGERIEVIVEFRAIDGPNPSVDFEEVAEAARVVVWISGERADTVESNEFDVLEGLTYSKRMFIDVPFDLDEDLETSRRLEVVVESDKDGTAASESIALTVQRESHLLEILAVDMQSEVQTGQSLAFDVVLKNRGRQLAEDTFLRIRIPELGLETQTYFGDLSPTDQGGSVADRDDAVERRTYLRIPSNAEVGLYEVVIEAFNDDSFASLERRVLIAGAAEDTMIVTPTNSKTFSTGDTGIYKLTIVNRGSIVRVYDIALDASAGLNLDITDPVIVVPAGSSRTVEISASSDVRDDYTFTAIIHSDGGKVVGDEAFTATITEGNGSSGTGSSATGNAAILLTVVLAIVFIVLLIVLIVLLTRKPDKAEEFGESYY